MCWAYRQVIRNHICPAVHIKYWIWTAQCAPAHARMANQSDTDYSGSCGDNFRPETVVIINCVLNVPLILISIIGNIPVVAAISRTPHLRSPSTILLCSLAFSDLLVGFVVQPLYIASELMENDFLYEVVNPLSFCACGVSLATMTAISVDRFLALHYHMRYPNLMTAHRALYASVTLWIVIFVISFSTFWKEKAYYFSAAVCIVICLLVSTFCYIRVYRIVRHHHLQIHAQRQAVENTETSQSTERSIKRAMDTFVFYIVLTFCYLPLFTAMVMFGVPRIQLTSAWNLTDTTAYMNSSVNPILFCWRFRELRTAVRKTVRQMLCRPTEVTSLT